jgi:hypothetical protein
LFSSAGISINRISPKEHGLSFPLPLPARIVDARPSHSAPAKAEGGGRSLNAIQYSFQALDERPPGDLSPSDPLSGRRR